LEQQAASEANYNDLIGLLTSTQPIIHNSPERFSWIPLSLVEENGKDISRYYLDFGKNYFEELKASIRPSTTSLPPRLEPHLPPKRA
jgi:hypothetical protein